LRNEKGQVEGVRYEELAPMLLNELQTQQQKLASQAEELQLMQAQIAELKRSMRGRSN
jgi:hypothetical protein